MNIKRLPSPFFVLAPMDDVTDTVFRQIVAETAPPDLFFTEFVNVDGLQSPGREKLLPKLRLGSFEGAARLTHRFDHNVDLVNFQGKTVRKPVPVIAQIWGKNPENYYKTVKELADGTLAIEASKESNLQNMDMSAVQGASDQQTDSYRSYDEGTAQFATEHSAISGDSANNLAVGQLGTIHNFAGVDINMGCPDKTVVKNGCCSALINNRELAGEIIQACQEAAGEHFPVSVKTRVGFTTIDLSWIEFLLTKKLNMLTIHLRTTKEMSKVPAHWELMREIKALRDRISPTTLLVGNGDVLSRQQGEEVAKQYGLDGVMIGRGVFHDPFVFAKDSPWPAISKSKKIALYKKHVELFAETWTNNERRVPTLNKFCKTYIQGFDSAKELREQLMNAKSTDELQLLLGKAI